MEITNLIEQNPTILRMGLTLEYNDARTRIATHIQRNLDRSKSCVTCLTFVLESHSTRCILFIHAFIFISKHYQPLCDLARDNSLFHLVKEKIRKEFSYIILTTRLGSSLLHSLLMYFAYVPHSRYTLLAGVGLY